MRAFLLAVVAPVLADNLVGAIYFFAQCFEDDPDRGFIGDFFGSPKPRNPRHLDGIQGGRKRV